MAEKEKGSEGGDKVPTQEQFDEQKASLQKQVSEANKRTKAAEGRLTEQRSFIVPPELDITLPDSKDEVTEEQMDKAKKGIEAGQRAASNLNQLVPRYVTANAKALAYEVVVTAEALDDLEDVVAKLEQAGTPTAQEALAKELALSYRETALSEKSSKGGKKKSKDDSSTSDGETFDQGGGGSVAANQVLKDIDDVDPNDPEAQKKLDALRRSAGIE